MLPFSGQFSYIVIHISQGTNLKSGDHLGTSIPEKRITDCGFLAPSSEQSGLEVMKWEL